VDTVYECDRQTDRQTDRITITNTVQFIASHGKNDRCRTTIASSWQVTFAICKFLLESVIDYEYEINYIDSSLPSC